ncbi:hypothetical protein [Georgenia muralis]|nr:hypothetical protein [Georgenia muralis]
MRTRTRGMAAAAAALLAGCGAGTEGDVERPGDAGSASSPATPTGGPSQPPSPGASSAAPTGAAALAVEDLTDRLGVAAEDVAVVRVEEVTWRDASLGCPSPGMAYAQVLTNGTLVVLEVDGTTYEYHSGGSRAPFLCENPQAPL